MEIGHGMLYFTKVEHMFAMVVLYLQNGYLLALRVFKGIKIFINNIIKYLKLINYIRF